MSQNHTLAAVLRAEAVRASAEGPGGGAGPSARQLRRRGYVPAVLYGRQVDNLLLAVEARSLVPLLATVSSSTLLTLTVAGQEPRRVLIQEVQRDPLSGDPLHVDFHQVDLAEKIRTRVPLRARGESPAVKDRGGVLVQSLDEVEVEALPGDLPEEIAFDLGRLQSFTDRLTVGDLAIPEGVELRAEPGEIVATVQPPRTEEELKELEETVEEKAAEVKTEAEERREKAEAEKAEAEAAEKKEAGKTTDGESPTRM